MKKIGTSLAEDDLAVQFHGRGENGVGYVRLEMRGTALSIDLPASVGLDLSLAEARELGRALLVVADEAESGVGILPDPRPAMWVKRTFP